MSPVVYAIRHLDSSAMYIGQTVDWVRRKRAHLHGLRNGKHTNKHLQHVFTKYGEDRFELCVIEYCDIDRLTQAEQNWVDQFRALGLTVCNFGTTVGKPTRGYRHSPDAIQKIRAAGYARTLSQEAREKIRVALIGRPRPPEVAAAVRLALTGLERPAEFSKKLSEHWAALPAEAKQKVADRARAVHTGRTRPESTRLKLSTATADYHAGRRAHPELWAAIVAESIVKYGAYNKLACVWASKQYKKRGGTHHD